MNTSFQHSKKRVCYFYDGNIGNYYYGPEHPMKPVRLKMTHSLIQNYGLYRKMEVIRPHKASQEEMTKFHSIEYIKFLKRITCENFRELQEMEERCGDCPVFDGLFEFCQLSAGGSIAGAIKLNRKDADIAINWSGGLHHAKKSQPSGFCYVNDVVLAIIELLKYHQRVLYIDIDVHHGDGVEEAFYTTDRVMTVSFHKFGPKFFPGTGDLESNGVGEGKYMYYAVNFPLLDGIDDEVYESVFQPLISKVMEVYQPSAVVLQCGADSLSEDRLGCFNLTIKGHGKCVEFVKNFNIPLLLVGGGGYNIKNVARCWTFETAVALDRSISKILPLNDYYEYFGPDFELHIHPSEMNNKNSTRYLTKIRTQLFENLRMLPPSPGIQQQDIPEDTIDLGSEDEDEQNPDERISIRASEKRIAKDEEFSDSEDEGDGRKDIRDHKLKRSFLGEESLGMIFNEREAGNMVKRPIKDLKTTIEL